MGDSHVGLQARLMSQAMRKLTSVIGKTNTVCVLINQLREKVGVVVRQPGGDHRRPCPEVLFFGAHRHPPCGGTLKDSSGQFIGNHTRAKIVKNWWPRRSVRQVDIMFSEGHLKGGRAH